MCDTLVALPAATIAGSTLFAKNSDRERNEAQALEILPAARHEPGASLQLTYIAIPQVARTHGCLISRPYWMWGAEMGANDRGVAIGNEAVHAVVPPSTVPALTGMDLVRLGLERGGSAAEAVEVMTALLERHGQGGDCGHLEPFHYHNSFIVADPSEAYVLETVGRWWAVETVERTHTLSNILGVGRGASYSPDVLAHARAEGWLDADGGGFDFADRFADMERDKTTRGFERRARSVECLAARRGPLAVADMIGVLRDHGSAAARDARWTPETIEGRTICMHAGHGDRRSQTVASMVGDLRPQSSVFWLTGTSAPCLSIFKPVTFASGLPDQGPPPASIRDDRSQWWRGEAVRRQALRCYPEAASALAPVRDELERMFRERMDDALARDARESDLRACVEDCWREAAGAEARWANTLGESTTPAPESDYHRSWDELGAYAQL